MLAPAGFVCLRISFQQVLEVLFSAIAKTIGTFAHFRKGSFKCFYRQSLSPTLSRRILIDFVNCPFFHAKSIFDELADEFFAVNKIDLLLSGI